MARAEAGCLARSDSLRSGRDPSLQLRSMTGVLYISASAIYYFMFKERKTAASTAAASV
ncbi:hypothetical protein MUG84_03870 [Paenibacillus sp. KQZ6P-2]|uniref:Uncharacterized protein n=1 Tax=Paenibacillus mangrovi TaxID=2931978 RepID=A0A9X1WKB1_9BACL|nr:hypothetical protein [Paenibacillus mangrovi]MCJ8010882.1 hypothetical protein [Paenibacillus mangrovi]